MSEAKEPAMSEAKEPAMSEAKETPKIREPHFPSFVNDSNILR